jgi:hypothetical protein
MAPKSTKNKRLVTLNVPITGGSVEVGDIITMAGMRITRKGKLKKCKHAWHRETPFIVGAVTK